MTEFTFPLQKRGMQAKTGQNTTGQIPNPTEPCLESVAYDGIPRMPKDLDSLAP